MRIVMGALIFLLFAILQTTLIYIGEIHGAKPDFLFVFVVYFALYFGRRVGTTTGFLAGLLLDLYEPRYLGIHALIYTLIGFIIGTLSERLYRERLLSQFLTLLFASLIGNFLYFLLLARPNLLLKVGLLQSLYTSVVGIVLFFFLTQIFEKWKKIS